MQSGNQPPNLFPLNNNQQTPSITFGPPQSGTTNVFGQAQNNPPNIFEQQKSGTTNLFGQPQNKPPNIFEQQQNAAPNQGSVLNQPTQFLGQMPNQSVQSFPQSTQVSNQSFGQVSNQPFGQMSNQSFGQVSNQPFGQVPNQTFNQPTQTTQMANQPIDIKSVPLSIRQSNLHEITTKLSKQLEDDIKSFKQKAIEVYSLDEEIIKTRNNYVRIEKMIEEEDKMLSGLEESIDLFTKYAEEIKVQNGNRKIKGIVDEIETIYDEFEKRRCDVVDDDKHCFEIAKENLNLIKFIDEKIRRLG